MRLIPLLAATTAILAGTALEARPLDVHVRGYRGARHAVIASYLVRHGLLTPEQAACATLFPAPHGSARVEHVSVYENYDGRCPGARTPPTYLFDVYVDTVSGVVDTTPESRDELLTVIEPVAPVRTP